MNDRAVPLSPWFLRDVCSACGGALVLDSWILIEDLAHELPRLEGAQRAAADELIALLGGERGVYVWLCPSCGELGAVQVGAF